MSTALRKRVYVELDITRDFSSPFTALLWVFGALSSQQLYGHFEIAGASVTGSEEARHNPYT